MLIITYTTEYKCEELIEPALILRALAIKSGIKIKNLTHIYELFTKYPNLILDTTGYSIFKQGNLKLCKKLNLVEKRFNEYGEDYFIVSIFIENPFIGKGYGLMTININETKVGKELHSSIRVNRINSILENIC